MHKHFILTSILFLFILTIGNYAGQAKLLNSITYLGLEGNEIGAHGAEALFRSKNLQNLVELSIGYNSVPLTTFVDLKKTPLGQHIRWLDITKNKIDADAVDVVARSLPKCRVVSRFQDY